MREKLEYFIKFKALYRKVGLYQAVKYSLKWLAKKEKSQTTYKGQSIVDFYRFIYQNPFGEFSSQNEQIINWVIPDFSVGSGGHLNIFRFIKKLEDSGFVCRINIDGGTHFSNCEEAKKCIDKNFFKLKAEVGIGRDHLKPASATFATSWTTAYTVRDYRGSGKKYYFVQDFEPYFTAVGSDYCFAEATYKFGFKAITAGSWLSNKLNREYGMEAVPFNFSFDRELYKKHPRKDSTKKRVLLYARPVTPRRATELGILTLTEISKKNKNIEFILAGWDMAAYDLPFPYLNAGVIPIKELPELYSQVDIAIVLSFTNLSLLPLEVMACGSAVVSNKGPNVEWLLNDDVACLSESTPEALCDNVLNLIENSQKLEELKLKGMQYALESSWDVEALTVIDHLKEDIIGQDA